jgi:peptide/nickel transport system permease protein
LAAAAVLLFVLVLAFAALGSLAGANSDDGPLVAPQIHATPAERQLMRESLGLDRPLLMNADVPTAARTARRAWARVVSELERLEATGSLLEVAPLLSAFPSRELQTLDAKHSALALALRELARCAPLSGASRAGVRAVSTAVAEACQRLEAQGQAALSLAGLKPTAPEREQQLEQAALACAQGNESEEQRRWISVAGCAALPHLARAAEVAQEPRAQVLWDRVREVAAIQVPAGSDPRAFTQRWWRRHADEFTPAGGLESIARSLSSSRCGMWIAMALRGDFGESTRHQRPVAEVLRERLPATMRTGWLALVLILALAIPLALLQLRARARLRLVCDGATAVALAVPETVVAVLALIVLEPARGNEWIAAGVLALGGIFYFAAHLRVRLEEVLAEPWVFALRMRGVKGQRLIFRHLLLPALSPVVTLTASALPLLVSGSVVVETMFGVPGMGSAAADATLHGDLPLAMSAIALGGAATLISWWLAEVVQIVLNPPRAARGVSA